MSFNDDELPSPNLSVMEGVRRRLPDAKPKRIQLDNVGKVRLVAYSNDKAPLEANTQQVMLELTGASSTGDRSGLDLVVVLDVSGSMGEDQKLDKAKTAMQFVIKKLSPIDRLSIVSFNDTAERLCPLRFVTEASQADLNSIVDGLKADSTTQIGKGLQKGLEVLEGRQLSSGRVASIILMSDGKDVPASNNWINVDVSNVAVHTFGFGADHDAAVLDEIARKSLGGTYSYVKDGMNLTPPFSQILGGLLSVVVQDLKLTVRQQPGDSEIEKVDPGYTQKQDANAGSVTVSFGDLYASEVRKVIVDLRLPAVRRRYKATAIIAEYSYSTQGETFSSPPTKIFIRRTGSANRQANKPEVETELARRHHATKMNEARKLADGTDLGSARDELVDAQNALKPTNPMINILRTELEQLHKLMESEDLYGKQGRPYARSTVTLHDRQRHAATKRMKMYVNQAKIFDENPTVPPPPADDDVKEERRAESMESSEADQLREPPRMWWGLHEHRSWSSSWWAWAMVILCTVLAIGMIVAGVTVFAVYLLYMPKMPYLVVSDAQLRLLEYGQDGIIQYLQVSITILAKNNNSEADASFSRVDLALRFHGTDVARLRAAPFTVARESSVPLQYNVVSAGRALDPAGMRSMDESLKAGVVPLDLLGKARTRWKVGIFLKLQFWTRMSCRLHFFPGNGTAMPTDLKRCRSRLP